MSKCRPPAIALDEERERETEREKIGKKKKEISSPRKVGAIWNDDRDEGGSADGCAKRIDGAQTDLRIGDLAQRVDD